MIPPHQLPKRPMPSSSNGNPSTSPQEEDQRVVDFRNATNFRSVTRNDPNVKEILETSVYSVIYHYDETAGEWEKQKQEGPLFIVKRDRSPEYALFMLNRQNVKNVLIPLVPGEMKCTVVDSSTLQVARRGEKQRRGVWFSDGQGDVDRFKRMIIRICGEPTKKTGAGTDTGSPAVPPPTIPNLPSGSSTISTSSALPAIGASQAAPQPTDDFSRLFAGLGVTSSSGRSVSDTFATGPPSRSAQGSHGTPRSDPSWPTQRSPKSDPAMTQPPVPINSVGQQSSGQSADDLLNSILGIGSGIAPTPPQPPVPSVPRQQDQTPQPTTQPLHHSQSNPVPLQGATLPPLPTSLTAQDLLAQWSSPPPSSPSLKNQTSRVGDATFAQAAASPPALIPTSHPPPSQHSSQFAPAPPPPPGPNTSLPPNPPGMNGFLPGPVEPLKDAVMYRVGHLQPGMRTKGQLVETVTMLLQHDERFVDDLWNSYLLRTTGGPG